VPSILALSGLVNGYWDTGSMQEDRNILVDLWC
jgi:hypothetical protein